MPLKELERRKRNQRQSAEPVERVAPALAEEDQPSLAEFCAQTDLGYQATRHTELLCRELEALERGDTTRLMVFMPPRHSKTYHTSERFPAWWMGKHPEHQIILSSYGATLAERSSRRARGLLRLPTYPFNTQIAADSKAVTHWETTAGGQVHVAGVEGGGTGFGAHLLVIDDPVKGRAEADSETYREKTWEWWTDTARTRLMPGGKVVLCQTRWHEDDLAGRILNSPNGKLWRVVSLPALAEDDDLLGRAPGEPLWPEWYGLDDLAEIRGGNARTWNALYQQRPTSDEGGIFKRAWWQRYASTGPVIFIYVDTASKTGLHNDYSVASAWASEDGYYDVVDVLRGRWEYPDLKRELRAFQARHGMAPLVIEDTSAGQALIQDFRRPEGHGDDRRPALPVIAFKVGSQTKIARASIAAGLVEAGVVRLPANARWVDDWIDEHAAFPTGAHDDMVDTTSIMSSHLPLRAAGSVALGQVFGGAIGIRRGG